jgi:hypothetical protein
MNHQESLLGPQMASTSAPPLDVEPDCCRETVKQFLSRRRIGREFESFPYHNRIAKALTRVGFIVKTVKRSDDHPVWSLSLRPGTVNNWRDSLVVRRLVSQALREWGHRCSPRDMGCFINGQVLQVSFGWEKGTPGILTFWSPNRVRPEPEN